MECVESVSAPLYAVDGLMGAPIHCYTNCGKLGVRGSSNNFMVSCLEAVNHPTLFFTSILDVWKVLE